MHRQSLIMAACIMPIPSLVMLGLIRVLNDMRSWKVLVVLASLLAAVGISLAFVGRMGAEGVATSVTPLFQTLLFRLGYTWFVRHSGREPVDTAMIWRGGLARDRVFSASYFLLSVLLPFAVIGSLLWGTAK